MNTNPYTESPILAGFWAFIEVVPGAAGAVTRTTPQFHSYQVDTSLPAVTASNIRAGAVVVHERRGGSTCVLSDSIAYELQKAQDGSPRADAVHRPTRSPHIKQTGYGHPRPARLEPVGRNGY